MNGDPCKVEFHLFRDKKKGAAPAFMRVFSVHSSEALRPPPTVLRNINTQGLADCPLPLPQSLLRSALSPERESLPGVGKTAEEAGTGGEEAGVDVDRVGREPSEEELLVLPGGEGAHAGENADGVDACAGGAGAEAGENGAGGADPGEDKRTGVEMLADHVRLRVCWMTIVVWSKKFDAIQSLRTTTIL